jgi:hypothetical protein
MNKTIKIEGNKYELVPFTPTGNPGQQGSFLVRPIPASPAYAVYRNGTTITIEFYDAKEAQIIPVHVAIADMLSYIKRIPRTGKVVLDAKINKARVAVQKP